MLLMTYQLHEASCLLCQRTFQFFYCKSRKRYYSRKKTNEGPYYFS